MTSPQQPINETSQPTKQPTATTKQLSCSGYAIPNT